MSEARELTAALGGRWTGRYGIAPCPICQTERRSDQTALTLSDGSRGLLLDCKKSRCGFSDILRAAGVPRRRNMNAHSPRAHSDGVADARKSASAKQLWDASTPICGTPAEKYLRDARKIEGNLPATLRFASRTWNGPARQALPAIVARIDGTDGFAVSRTYLRCDGSAKAEIPEQYQRLMLGRVRGGHVALKAGSGTLILAEGIETALSLPVVLNAPDATVWAALTATNMRSLSLPERPERLIIAADGDVAGRKASEALARRASSLGWFVHVRTAPEGQDWNDVLKARVGAQDHGV